MLNPLGWFDQRTSNCLKLATLIHGAIIVAVSTAQIDFGALSAGDQETIEFTALDAGPTQLPKGPIVEHIPVEIPSVSEPLPEARKDDVAIVTKPKPKPKKVKPKKKVKKVAKKKEKKIPTVLPEKKVARETEVQEESPVKLADAQNDLDKALDEDLEALEKEASLAAAKAEEERRLEEEKRKLEEEKLAMEAEKQQLAEQEKQARIEAARLALEKEKAEAAKERARIAAQKAAVLQAQRENAMAEKINKSIQYGSGQGNSTTTVTGYRNYLTLKQKPGNPSPQYPAVAQRQGAQGKVIFKYFVNADGSIRSLHIVKSSGNRYLDQSATKAIQQYKFYPGQAGWTEHAVAFQLKGKAVEAPTRLRTQFRK